MVLNLWTGWDILIVLFRKSIIAPCTKHLFGDKNGSVYVTVIIMIMVLNLWTGCGIVLVLFRKSIVAHCTKHLF